MTAGKRARPIFGTDYRSPLSQSAARRFPNRGKIHRHDLANIVMSKGSGHFPAQLLWGDPAGLPAPQIDGQLTGQGDDGLFAFATMRALGQEDVFPFLEGATLGLEADHAPGQFDEEVAQAGVAMLGNGQVQVCLAAGTDAAAQAGQGADLLAVVEAIPVTDFVGGTGQGQRAQAQGTGFGGLGNHRLSQGRQLLVQRQQDRAKDGQTFDQPGGQLDRELVPGEWLPPMAFNAMALGQHEAPAHGLQALTFATDLFALTRDTAALFFLGGRDADRGKGLAVAGQETIQTADQFGGIGFIGVDAFAQRVELHGADNEDLNAPGLELAGQTETAGAGFIDGEDLFGLGQLLFDKAFQVESGIDPLGRLGTGAIELPDKAQVGGVLINAQEDPVIERVCRLRIDWDCGENLVMSVGLHIYDEVNCLFTNLRCRRSRLLPTLMPSLDR